MEDAKIFVTRSMDGFTFRLSTDTKHKLKARQAHPADSLYLANGVKHDFELYRGTFIPHIFPSLAGFNEADDSNEFDEIVFVDPLSGKTLLRYSQKAGKIIEK